MQQQTKNHKKNLKN